MSKNRYDGTYEFRGVECWLACEKHEDDIHFNFGDFTDDDGKEFFYHCIKDSEPGLWSCKWYNEYEYPTDFTAEEEDAIMAEIEKLENTVFAEKKTVSKRIKINDCYSLHKPFFLTLKPGYTALVGPNGAGKTTMLLQLREYAQYAQDIIVWKYSNLLDGGDNAKQMYDFNNETSLLIAAITSSEGEEIAVHFGQAVRKLGQACKKAKDEGKEIFVLLDSLDSGASIDRMRELLSLFKMVIGDMGESVYIIAAVNSYEMTMAPARCINVRTGKEVKFNSYENYADFICTFEEKFPRLEDEE